MNRVTLLLIAACCAATVAQAVEPPQFRYRRDANAPGLEQEELVAITLDAHVYDATRDGLPDLQLRRADGALTPFIVLPLQATETRTVRNAWRADNLSARPLEDGADGVGLEIIVQLDDDDPIPTGVTLTSRLRNFEQRVRVENSDDGQAWEPTGQETVIFDYSQYIDMRNVEISLPETDRRHFRILIDDVTIEQESELLQLTRRLGDGQEEFRDEQTQVARRPFRIERVEFWRETQQPVRGAPKKRVYPTIEFQVEEDAEKKQTRIEIFAQRQPLTSFRIDTPSRNFSRRATVERLPSGAKPTWRRIGEATLSRIDFKSLQREQLDIDFSETRGSEYRVVIENRDSPPLAVTGVEAHGNVFQVVFLADPEQSYELVYGSLDAEPTSLDTQAIGELLRQGFAPTVAQLGDPVELDVSPAPTRWSDMLANPRFLFAVVTVLVLLLGWGLVQATKRVDKMAD